MGITPHIVVLGAGFGGLTFCRRIGPDTGRITLVDRQNHHLFQPLLYQVATAGLSQTEIAQPIRSIVRDQSNVTVRLGEIQSVDFKRKKVVLADTELTYDHLVVALGGVTSYFGHPEWETAAPGLKSLNDALQIRRQVLLAFERAETTIDERLRQRLMSIVVVGGGPTGVELAGAFAELTQHVLRKDFRRIDPTQARVVLVEGGPRLLPYLPPNLSDRARDQLEQLGVEVRLSAPVQDIQKGGLKLPGETLEAETIVWAAGVCASPLTRTMDAELDRAGRVKVNPDLSVPNYSEVFAIGDIACVMDESGVPVPGVAPAAMQMAAHVADIIESGASPDQGDTHDRAPFHYWDKGTMATIGRSAAVAKAGAFEFTGRLAWFAWLIIHLLFLVGFRNRIAVVLQWIYSYLSYRRGARIFTRPTDKRPIGSSQARSRSKPRTGGRR